MATSPPLQTKALRAFLFSSASSLDCSLAEGPFLKVSTARASPVVILVDFLSSLPLGIAAIVLEAYPVVDSVAILPIIISRPHCTLLLGSLMVLLYCSS